MAKTSELLSFQDKDGSLRSALDVIVAMKQEQNPQDNVTLSSVIRAAIVEGIPVLTAKLKPRLESKQVRGSLRK